MDVNECATNNGGCGGGSTATATCTNTTGGFSPIRELGFDGSVASVDGKPRVFALQAPQQVFATAFDAGMVTQHLAANRFPEARQVKDESGLASGAMFATIISL